MESTVPCKLKTTKSSFRHRETCSESNEIQTSKHACIVEAHESTRNRFEKTPPKDEDEHIAEKVFISLSNYNLAHRFILMRQAMKNPGCESSSGQRMELR